MARFLGLTVDPQAGGSTYDVLSPAGAAIAWPAPTLKVPVTTATADPGENKRERNDEVTGRRGNIAPVAFSEDPSFTFSARAYPGLLKALISRALGNLAAPTGVAPAAITTKADPIQSGSLPALIATAVRETQTDFLSGLVVGELTLDFPADEDATIQVAMDALYREAAVTGAPAQPATVYGEPMVLRDVKAYGGATGVTPIPCLGGLGLTFNNGLVKDLRTRYCAGANVKAVVAAGKTTRIWYPGKHKIGPQTITGRLDFGVERPDLETRRALADAEKLVIELVGYPLATTPVVNELVRITLHREVLTGGGASELVREGDITSSYEFGGFVDPTTNKDIEVEFLGTAAYDFTAAKLV